jgi:hypothetical protein
MVDRLRPHNVRSPGTACAWAPATEGCISELIEYTDVAALTGTVLIGTVPAGAQFTGCEVNVITAFNAGAADALIVGTTADTNYLIEDGHPTMAQSVTSETNVLDWKPTSNTLVYATYTHTGAAPTTGKALVTVTFEQPL